MCCFYSNPSKHKKLETCKRMGATHDRIPWVNLPIFPAARKPSMGHFSPDREPRMSNVPISAPVAVRLSESLRSHRCQEGEGLRAVTIVRPRRGLLRRDVKRRGRGFWCFEKL